jgi:hypothetical protein
MSDFADRHAPLGMPESARTADSGQAAARRSGERLAIPYERTTLPGLFLRAPDAVPGEPRPVIVFNHGWEMPTSLTLARAGSAAREHGYHLMSFDGPGQYTTLRQRGIASRPDWEAVLTPVLDALLARADVDGQHVAVIGTHEGGYLVARALCYEHRFAAAVLDPGIWDLSTPYTDPLPANMRDQLHAGDREGFDRVIRLAELFSPALASTICTNARQYGCDGSRFDLYQMIGAYRLGDEVSEIITPTLITDTWPNQPWRGQAQKLYGRLTSPKTMLPLDHAHDAHHHHEPSDPTYRYSQMFDWLDRYLS